MKTFLTAFAFAVATLPLPALANDYPPCTAARTDQCTQVAAKVPARSAHAAKRPMVHGKVKSPIAAKRVPS